MKQYRYKNVGEFKRDFGECWREEADFPSSMDELLGKPLSNIQNAAIERYGAGETGWSRLFLNIIGINTRQIVEIPTLSCDVDKVYFDEDKKRVTVILRNGNEGRSTCAPEDTYDPYVGFAIAYTRAMAGSATKLRKFVDMRRDRQLKKKK